MARAGAKRAAARARAKRKPMAMVALPLQTKPSLTLLLSLVFMGELLCWANGLIGCDADDCLALPFHGQRRGEAGGSQREGEQEADGHGGLATPDEAVVAIVV